MNTPFITLNTSSFIPPYEQIRLQIQMAIVAAQLSSGMALPSVRQLARDLGVAPNTIARAYSELERDGWVVTSARKGVSVASSPPTITEEERKQRLELAVTQLLVTTRQLAISDEELYAEIERQTAVDSADPVIPS
jgi:DNA-binding transcriptional regulator YhcF (GntR family)